MPVNELLMEGAKEQQVIYKLERFSYMNHFGMTIEQ